jgi:hypothetical protein
MFYRCKQTTQFTYRGYGVSTYMALDGKGILMEKVFRQKELTNGNGISTCTAYFTVCLKCKQTRKPINKQHIFTP